MGDFFNEYPGSPTAQPLTQNPFLENPLEDPRVRKFAQILVEYSTEVKPGDYVAIATTTIAEPLVRELYSLVLERGGHPHILMNLPDQEELLFEYGNEDQLEFVPRFHKTAFEEFDVLIKVRAQADPRGLSEVPPERQSIHQRALSALIGAQMRRGAEGSLRWMSTMYPTPGYAKEAGMNFEEYKDFVYRAIHADADTPDPVAHWQAVEQAQKRYIDLFQGHDRVQLRGPNVDLSLSIKGRTFLNACGHTNMPDGEIFTGPVEDSVNGWVRFTYPAMTQGRIVDGVELAFEEGKVAKASARENQDFMLEMLNIDEGARYVGEFAIGTNYQIDRFTKSILFDEKIGGSFHMAVGAGYPETGSLNRSMIHWDMICDMRQDSEILVDGEVVYRDGQFVI
jgi:aminopeptidase